MKILCVIILNLVFAFPLLASEQSPAFIIKALVVNGNNKIILAFDTASKEIIAHGIWKQEGTPDNMQYSQSIQLPKTMLIQNAEHPEGFKATMWVEAQESNSPLVAAIKSVNQQTNAQDFFGKQSEWDFDLKTGKPRCAKNAPFKK